MTSPYGSLAYIYLNVPGVMDVYNTLFPMMRVDEHETQWQRTNSKETTLGIPNHVGGRWHMQQMDGDRVVFRRAESEVGVANEVGQELARTGRLLAAQLSPDAIALPHPLLEAVADQNPVLDALARRADRWLEGRGLGGLFSEVLEGGRKDIAAYRQRMLDRNNAQVVNGYEYLALSARFEIVPHTSGVQISYVNGDGGLNVSIPVEAQFVRGPGSAMLIPGQQFDAICVGRRVAYDPTWHSVTIWPLWVMA